MEIIDYKEREMIPLTHDEHNFYNEQEACHICKERFCVDKDDKNYKNKRKVIKIIVITQGNLEELLIVNTI